MLGKEKGALLVLLLFLLTLSRLDGGLVSLFVPVRINCEWFLVMAVNAINLIITITHTFSYFATCGCLQKFKVNQMVGGALQL